MRIGFDGRWYNYSGVGNYISGLLRATSGSDEDLEIILYEDEWKPGENVDSWSRTACG
jgi:hypothetical protein